MNRYSSFLPLSLLTISVCGFGCFSVGPRVVQAPTPMPIIGSTPKGDTGMVRALAYIALTDGMATVTRGGRSAPAEEGLELTVGDQVAVSTGTISLIYPDSGESRLDAGTDIILLPHGGSATSTDSIGVQIELIAGKIWTRFERLLGPMERFSVSSNNIVATVRGTAFGVSRDADGIDVQVADHQVDITSEGIVQASIVRLVAGEGLRATSALFAPAQSDILRQTIRTLSISELARPGYVFGLRPIDPQRLKAPIAPVRLRIQASIPSAYTSRVEALRTAFQNEIRFAAPTRLPIMREQVPTSSTPGVNGPTL